jgi:hypothetical protein
VLILRLAKGRDVTEAEVSGDDELSTDSPFPVQFRPTDLLK